IRSRRQVENRIGHVALKMLNQRGVANVESIGQRAQTPSARCVEFYLGLKKSPSNESRMPGHQQFRHDCPHAPRPGTISFDCAVSAKEFNARFYQSTDPR